MQNNYEYYESLKSLAREKRTNYNVNTASFGLRELRNIYAAEGVRIDSWPYLPRKIKAIYMCADDDCSVAIQSKLPKEPRLFALVHELKHHYRDQDILRTSVATCGDYYANRKLEIGAEIFAAEFIYPEQENRDDFEAFDTSLWTPENVVEFKRGCSAKNISYRYVCKRLEWFRLIKKGQFDTVKFKNLEEEIYGRPKFRRRRGTRKE